jgi:branched-chain amino acid transport system permease protein
VAVGAYGYCYFAGHKTPGVESVAGLGLPPILALVLAVLLAGLCGALFSPISGRLRGIYLGIASIGLVFIGQHILFNATGLTGGFNGRDAEPFSVAGFDFTQGSPDVTIAGVGFGELEKLWYLGLALVAVALVFGRLVPDTFGFALSVDFLVMIVIGGLGSIGGAALGAVFVSMLPRVFDHYSDSLPLVASAGSSGLQPSQAARLLYGVAIIAVLLYARGGLAALGHRLRPKQPGSPRRARRQPTIAEPARPSSPELKETSR